MLRKPIRSHTHIKEDLSKRKFEDVIHPFFVSAWTQKDYGIDCVVEITTGSPQGNIEIDSKCFLVQLKSTEKLKSTKDRVSYVVQVRNVVTWANYNSPVCFIVYDIVCDTFYYLWIDDILLAQLESSNPTWDSQETISLPIPKANILNTPELEKIKQYVYASKVKARRKLDYGKFFNLKERVGKVLIEYKEITKQFPFKSIKEAQSDFDQLLEQSIYKIALTGPSRVGKSSLINAILEHELSPVGFYQTTGVPIQIIPGSKQRVTIYFEDGQKNDFPFSLKKITEYASQEFNEENKKKVHRITVEVKNKNLESGISIYDLPGLDDPNDEIIENTWQTVRQANAIIYVIDGSPAKNGGYIFNDKYKKHLQYFGQSQDKVFLVVNKVDDLKIQVLRGLKDRLNRDLEKYQLKERIGDKLFYLNATGTKSNKEIDSIDKFREAIWNFILEENKHGIVKLSLLNQDIFKSTSSFQQLLNSRLIDSEKRLILEDSIDKIKTKIPSLSKEFKHRHKEILSSLINNLDLKHQNIIKGLENGLLQIELQKDLPNSKAIKKYLIDNINITIDQSNRDYVYQVNRLKEFMDGWIEENLKQVREVLNGNVKTKQIDFTDVHTFNSPQIDTSASLGMGFLGAVLGFIVAPEIAILSGLVSFLGSLITTAESRRKIRISKIVEDARNRSSSVFRKIKSAYKEQLGTHANLIANYVDKKLTTFFDDIEDQISQLNTTISQSDKKKYELAISEIETFRTKLIDLDAELRSFYF